MRSAQPSIDDLIQEFDSLKGGVDLLQNDFEDRIPKALHDMFSGIVVKCTDVASGIDELFAKYNLPLATKKIQWAASGKDELEKLKVELKANSDALVIVMDVVNLVINKDVKHDTEILKKGQQHILQEIEQLKQRLPPPSPYTAHPANIPLQQHLDDISSYAGSVIVSTPINTNELRQRFAQARPTPELARPPMGQTAVRGPEQSRRPAALLPVPPISVSSTGLNAAERHGIASQMLPESQGAARATQHNVFATEDMPPSSRHDGSGESDLARGTDRTHSITRTLSWGSGPPSKTHKRRLLGRILDRFKKNKRWPLRGARIPGHARLGLIRETLFH
ncbi:Uu.00g137330.m01.CDS01 [Anthostomella pinea]|uniref:Uu.00g137330.m01.CDS01 n=1 Tax=Anthostomella pinea TaxID=933095 RepID=A0AAI8VPI7_9PEZI|nr:Uu.00g137330.m01.CDS01 [Anthostomella pinea]